MMADTELDNMVLKKQLSKKFINKVNIGYGVDDNKIKGIDNFPIYDATKGFQSRARPNVDEFMFLMKDKKYDMGSVTHTSVGEIQPDYFSRHQKRSTSENTNTRFA